jgi:hypothetical protein
MDILTQLESVFGEGVVTGLSMIRPSPISKEQAAQAVKDFQLGPVLRDLGIVCAREIANELEGMGLRPADYLGMSDLVPTVIARLADALSGSPSEVFQHSFLATLRLRG